MAAKLPDVFKEEADDLMDDLKHVKKITEKMNEHMDEFKAKGKECHEKKKLRPKDAYFEVFGPIYYSKKVRRKWEKYMRKKCWRKHRKWFRPHDYPTTYMKADK